jgi:hypothetical protein
MGHDRLDFIVGSYLIPVIDFPPHKSSKTTGSGFTLIYVGYFGTHLHILYIQAVER